MPDSMNRSAFDTILAATPRSDLTHQPKHFHGAPPAGPDEKLVSSLQPRPTLSDGRPVNDRAVPAAWDELGRQNSFWEKVSGYFVNKHLQQDSVYASPYARGRGGASSKVGPTHAWCEELDDEGKAKIEAYMNNAREEKRHATR